MILSDMTMVDRLSSRGFMVTVRTDAAVRATDAQGKGAVLLSGSTSLANIMTNLAQAPDLEVPLLAMDENLEPFLNLTAAPDTDHGTTNGTQVAILDDADDDLTGGLEGTVTIFNVEFNISWGVPGPEAERVATVVGNDDQVAMFVYDEGDEMANDEEAPAKRAFFFVRDSPTANLMTEDALEVVRCDRRLPRRSVSRRVNAARDRSRPDANFFPAPGRGRMHLFSMAQLNAQSKRAAPAEAERPEEIDPPPEADLRATIALSPEALAALIDEVKRAQADAGPSPDEALEAAGSDEADAEELTSRLSAEVRRPPLAKRPGGE